MIAAVVPFSPVSERFTTHDDLESALVAWARDCAPWADEHFLAQVHSMGDPPSPDSPGMQAEAGELLAQFEELVGRMAALDRQANGQPWQGHTRRLRTVLRHVDAEEIGLVPPVEEIPAQTNWSRDAMVVFVRAADPCRADEPRRFRFAADLFDHDARPEGARRGRDKLDLVVAFAILDGFRLGRRVGQLHRGKKWHPTLAEVLSEYRSYASKEARRVLGL